MNLQAFNQASDADLQAYLQHCVHIPSWINAIAQARPFNSQQQLLDYAEQQSKLWSWSEIKAALDTHPRIGERKAAQHLSEQETAFSNQEQANVELNQTTEKQLLQGNLEYEAKFGYIFLIKAAGLTAKDILDALSKRLKHTPEQEQSVVQQHLAAIAVLRLSQAVTA